MDKETKQQARSWQEKRYHRAAAVNRARQLLTSFQVLLVTKSRRWPLHSVLRSAFGCSPWCGKYFKLFERLKPRSSRIVFLTKVSGALGRPRHRSPLGSPKRLAQTQLLTLMPPIFWSLAAAVPTVGCALTTFCFFFAHFCDCRNLTDKIVKYFGNGPVGDINGKNNQKRPKVVAKPNL